jgi:hypothetical protein
MIPHRHAISNKDLAALIKRTPLKLKGCIQSQEQYFNLEKQDFILCLLENPDDTHWEVQVDRAIWVHAITN